MLKNTKSLIDIQINNPPNLEREVKILLPKLPSGLKKYVDIRQGYLAKNEPFIKNVVGLLFSHLNFDYAEIDVVRIRDKVKYHNGCGTGKHQYILTAKGPGLFERKEYEIEIKENLFNTLWQKTTLGFLVKRRYEDLININGQELIVEIDEYQGKLAGLYTAEIEIKDPHLRPYLLPFIKERYLFQSGEVRDITEEPAYKNNHLALRDSYVP